MIQSRQRPAVMTVSLRALLAVYLCTAGVTALFVSIENAFSSGSGNQGSSTSSSLLLNPHPTPTARFAETQSCYNEMNDNSHVGGSNGNSVDVTAEVAKRGLTSLRITCNVSSEAWYSVDPFNFNYELVMYKTTSTGGINWPVPFTGNCSAPRSGACAIPQASVVTLANFATNFSQYNQQTTVSVVVPIPPKTPVVLGVAAMTPAICMLQEDAADHQVSCEVLWSS